MITITITTNQGQTVIQAAEISQAFVYNRYTAWHLDKPISINGVNVPDEAYIDFGENAVITVNSNVIGNGFVCLNMENRYGELRCYIAQNNVQMLPAAQDVLGDPIELNDISGGIGPFTYNINLHLDTEDFTQSYFAISLSAMGVSLCNAHLDINNPKITFGTTMCGIGAKGTLGVDFDGCRIYLDAEVSYFAGTKKFSYDLYSWKNCNVQFVPSKASNAIGFSSATDDLCGSISIENRGAYVAKFTVSYDLDGKRITKETDNFTSGVTKSIEIPAGATAISLCAMDAWFIGQWNDIFAKTFEEPVVKKYRVSGTTLNTAFEEITV